MKRKYREHEIVWHPNDIKRERILIIALVTFILIFSVFAVALYSQIFGVRESSWATHDMHWNPEGTDWYQSGAFTDPVTDDTSELFSKSQYIGSYMRGGDYKESEPVFIQGKFRASGGVTVWTPRYYWYVVSWSDSLDGPWTVISEPGNTQEFVTMDNPGKLKVPEGYLNTWKFVQSYWFSIKGDYKNFIKVEFNIEYTSFAWKETKTAWDVCQMKSGVGELFVDGNQFEVGENVTFTMNTGISGTSVGEPDKGWTLILYDPNGNPYKTWDDIPDNARGVERTWTVPTDAFKRTWSNIFEAVLYNSIIDYSDVHTVIIDDKSLAPSAPEITFSGGSHAGESVAITLSSTPNSVSKEPIDHFVVYVKYAEGDYIIYKQTVPATQGTGTLTVTPQHGGSDIVVQAVAVDAYPRTSDISEKSKHIYHPTRPSGSNNLWWYALAGIMGVGTIGGVIYYATDKRKYPPYRPREPYSPQQPYYPQQPPRR